MLIDQNLPMCLWAEAVYHANYVQNRLPYKSEKLIPMEEFLGTSPNYNFMFEFGKFVYVHVPKEKRRKLEPKAVKMRFMGFDFMSKAFRLFDGFNVRVSRDVNFMQTLVSSKEERERIQRGAKIVHEEKKINSQSNCINFMDLLDFATQKSSSFNITNDRSADDVNNDRRVNERIQEQNDPIPENPLNSINDRSSLNNSRSRIPRPRTAQFQGNYRNFFSARLSRDRVEPEPTTFKQATNCRNAEKWMAAMHEEISSIDAHDVWELTDLPAGKKAIGSKWVYSIKHDVDGNIERYKARLVAKGFSQKYGEHYQEVFAPVGRPETFRILLSVAAEKNLFVNQFDVKTAFLNGKLTEEIYLKQPEGFERNNSQVYRLHKSIYGLKQAARSWNQALIAAMKAAGAVQSENDECLFILRTKDDIAYILVHVDDMLVATGKKSTLLYLDRVMNQHFETKNLGDVKQFLGIRIERINGKFFISQPRYIEKVIKDFGQEHAKVSFYPIDPGYYKLEGLSLSNNSEYRSIIGSLLYLANHSRPDIAASVTILSRHVQKPRDVDLINAKNIIRYLKGTKHLKLCLNSSISFKSLTAFVDADFAEDKTDRKSTTGYMVFLNGGLISYRSRKQSIVALSTAEAEYVAISEVCQQLAWLNRLCSDFEIVMNEDQPLKFFSDNQSAIALTKGECSHRTKHIDTKYHYIRQAVENGEVSLHYVPSEYNLADILTKPLNSVKIKQLRNGSGLIEAEEEEQ